MQEYKRQIVEAANAIRARVDSHSDTALVLGSGSGGFAAQMESAVRIPYGESAAHARFHGERPRWRISLWRGTGQAGDGDERQAAHV